MLVTSSLQFAFGQVNSILRAKVDCAGTLSWPFLVEVTITSVIAVLDYKCGLTILLFPRL